MWWKVLAYFSVIAFAFGVLFISIFRSASIKYEFNGETAKVGTPSVLGEKNINVDYYLAYSGKVLPDSFLWPVKALRDRLWLFITVNPSRRAELKLLFADKRLVSAKTLFEKEKSEIAYATLTKAEKYLEEANSQEKQNREKGIDTSEFLRRLSYASLKHYEVMEEIIEIAPEDAGPKVIETQKYPIRVYELTRDALYEKDLQPAENPFDWQ